MKYSVIANSYQGMKKPNKRVNQDYFTSDPSNGIFIIADGMGGHEKGMHASKVAVNYIHSSLVDLVARRQGRRLLPESITRVQGEAIKEASQMLYGISDELGFVGNGNKKPLGTTIDSLLLADDTAYISHVGDSMVYLFSKGNVIKLTNEHSEHPEIALKFGDISKPCYESSMNNYVGLHKDEIIIDTVIQKLEVGDILLMATDGIPKAISPGELKYLLSIFTDENTFNTNFADAMEFNIHNPHVMPTVYKILHKKSLISFAEAQKKLDDDKTFIAIRRDK